MFSKSLLIFGLVEVVVGITMLAWSRQLGISMLIFGITFLGASLGVRDAERKKQGLHAPSPR